MMVVAEEKLSENWWKWYKKGHRSASGKWKYISHACSVLCICACPRSESCIKYIIKQIMRTFESRFRVTITLTPYNQRQNCQTTLSQTNTVILPWWIQTNFLFSPVSSFEKVECRVFNLYQKKRTKTKHKGHWNNFKSGIVSEVALNGVFLYLGQRA